MHEVDQAERHEEGGGGGGGGRGETERTRSEEECAGNWKRRKTWIAALWRREGKRERESQEKGRSSGVEEDVYACCAA